MPPLAGERWWRSHQRGIAFPHPQGGCMVFAAKGGIRNGAEGAVPRQRSDTIYLPRARALNPPVRRSRSQAEPWQPRAERPGGWLNPHARKGVSTFGNTGKHRSQSRSRSRPHREAPEPSSPIGGLSTFRNTVHHPSGRGEAPYTSIPIVIQ